MPQISPHLGTQAHCSLCQERVPCPYNSRAGVGWEQLQHQGAKVNSPLVLALYFTGAPVVEATEARGMNSAEPEQPPISMVGNRCVSMELLGPSSTMLVGAL